MSLINCTINLVLTWSENCVISEWDRETTFAITDTKLHVPVITLSTQANPKLLKQLKSAFKRTINWNKCQLRMKIQEQHQYLDYLIHPSFQGVNIVFVLSFEDNAVRTGQAKYFFQKLKIREHNVMINGKNNFDQPVKNDLQTYNNIQKITTGQGDDYTTSYLLDYPYFKENYKLIVMDLNKKQALHANPETIQQINFTENLEQDENTTMFFIFEEVKETILVFSQGTLRVL